jgi:ribosome-associated protein
MPQVKPARDLSSDKLANIVNTALDDMKAQDIKQFPVGHLTSITDFMVIASGRSDRHVRAIASAVRECGKAAGYKPLGVEGEDSGEWILVDLGDVVVHVMVPTAREFYNLEKLWDMAPQVGAPSRQDPAPTNPSPWEEAQSGS